MNLADEYRIEQEKESRELRTQRDSLLEACELAFDGIDAAMSGIAPCPNDNDEQWVRIWEKLGTVLNHVTSKAEPVLDRGRG